MESEMKGREEYSQVSGSFHIPHLSLSVFIPSFLFLSLSIHRVFVDIKSSCTSLVTDEDVMRELSEGTEGCRRRVLHSLTRTDESLLVFHPFCSFDL